MLDARHLPAEHYQPIAREMNQAETAFVRAVELCDGHARIDVRYYTPAEEIPLAGHPTIAVAAALVHTGSLQIDRVPVSVTFDLRDGPVIVDIRRLASNGLTHATMTQRAPHFMATYDAEEILSAFGLRTDDLLQGVPVQTVSMGTPQLMVPLRDHDALRRARLNASEYEGLRERGDFFSPHLFCLGGMTAEGATSARHFGIHPDIAEDPVTGSATGGMAAYLWHYRLIQNPVFIAEQGHWMGRPGRVEVEVVGSRSAIEAVRIAGTAVIVMEGRLTY